MSKLKKVWISLKKDGLIRTIKKVLRVIKYKLFARPKKNFLDGKIDLEKYDTIIIFENNFGWNKIMKQRPQQIAYNFPDNVLMFYHSHEDNDYDNKKRVKFLKDNLVIVDLGYYRDALLEKLINHNNKYVMVYSTDYIPYDRIKLYNDYGYELIYEYVDDFSSELSGKEMFDMLTKRHKQIKKDNPFVICTATELYNKCKNDGFEYIELISNGVDYEHFKAQQREIPTDLVEIKNNYKVLICYYGALASWFDYDLIKEVAKNNDYAIVLLGKDYDGTLNKSGILKLDNVYYLGKKDYNELPNYGANVDLLIIPFLINNITKATSPVKVFEYMAMEKPIITTALPECQKYKSVLWSKNHKDFINNLEKGLKLQTDKKYNALLSKEALENTWKSKANNMINFVNQSRVIKLKKMFADAVNSCKFDRIVIWRSPFGYNVPLFQRPQHIAKQLSKQKCLVIYEITTKTDDVKTFKMIDDNLILVNFENYNMNCILKETINNINKDKYLQIYSTNWSMSLDELKQYEKDGFKVLYEYIDDISPDLAGTDEIPPYIIDKYNYAMSNKKVLVVTTAEALYNDVKEKRGTKNLAFACNGVDYDFYQRIEKNYKYEKEFLHVVNNGKINVCYYGALATWFDYELIRKINATDKYNIVLFGIKYDQSYDDSGIDKLKNVHFFGPRDYAVLKNYASKMNILMIPFLINSITQATSPLKLFEYMALHKPIVTTAMNECKKYESVLIAENHDEFLEKLAQADSLQKSKKYLSLLEKEGKENDWKQKAKSIIDLMEKTED